MPKYFIYIKGLRGPMPQIWNSIPVDGNGKPSKEVLQQHEIADNDHRVISQLMIAYPYVSKADEQSSP